MHIKSLLVVSTLTVSMFVGASALANANADSSAAAVALEQPAHQAKSHKHKHRKYKHRQHPSVSHRDDSYATAPRVSCLQQHHCSNFLVGGQAAYARQKERFVSRFSSEVTNPALEKGKQEEKISNNGVNLGLLVGWQHRWDRALLGVEGAVDFQDFDRPRPFVFSTLPDVNPPVIFNGTAQYDRGILWQLTSRAGYFVTPAFMPYVRLGAQASRDEVNYQVFLQPADILVVPAFADANSKKQTVWGVVAGLGAEFPTLIGGSTIRFEYTFTRSESIEIDDIQAPLVGKHKFHSPETNALKVAWIWNFL